MAQSAMPTAKLFSGRVPAEGIMMILFWSLYFLMAFLGRGTFWSSFEPASLYAIIFSVPLVFLIHSYFLIPVFAQKQRWPAYVLLMVLLQIGIEVLRWSLSPSRSIPLFDTPNTTGAYVSAWIGSWLYVSVRDWLVNVRVIERLKSEKLQTELDFLKVQIDPHFLFNTLNSIYALALEESSPKTADSIVKLSALMRYNLHDSNRESISIEKEIDYLEKYIALQMLRLNENNKVEVDIQIDDNISGHSEVAPLILIPFIENVFKYGVSPSKATAARIQLRIEKGLLELFTENDIVASHAMEGRRNGIGLQNTRSRLQLLYPNRFELSSIQEHNRYYTTLKIQLYK